LALVLALALALALKLTLKLGFCLQLTLVLILVCWWHVVVSAAVISVTIAHCSNFLSKHSQAPPLI
jgi:hypothetical protein